MARLSEEVEVMRPVIERGKGSLHPTAARKLLKELDAIASELDKAKALVRLAHGKRRGIPVAGCCEFCDAILRWDDAPGKDGAK